MQRWIYLTIMVCLVIGGGMLFYLMKMRENRPDSRWIAMPVRTDLSAKQKTDVVENLTKYVQSDRTRSEVVEDLKLVKLFNVQSEEEAKNELLRRSFVRLSKGLNPMTNQEVETIDIGVNGLRKEVDALDKIAVHLGNKVEKMILESEEKANKPLE
jgi:hypothetical protein